MSTVYYLIGWPGSGKRTVGLALAALTGARLLDNHLINDPIFQAVGATGVGPLPEGTWPLVGRVEAAVLEAVMLAPPELSFIFTNVLVQRPGELDTFESRRRLADARNARFVPVWLLCSEPELRRRIPLDDRRARLKMRDEAGLTRMLEQYGALLSPPPDALMLHTDHWSPEETARQIVAHTCS
ncbi:hypothetical protein [Deinococcus sp.]|uniref:hypothetical protein n=1 Tax=Deinococcus sp. TaxID=47478 RepID=UPI0025E873E8|nr:hypothetical protein [Deinococcus sp.]